jgi:hypothetical protein
MREVGSYLRKIDAFFRIDEIKIEAKECKLDLAELGGEHLDLESTSFLLQMDRIAHETKYNLFLKSSAAMIYSAFELSLRSVAEAVSEVTGVKKNVKKYKGKSSDALFCGDIGTYALYLIEVHQLEWSELDEMWGRINNFRFVRNHMVHKGGELDIGDYKFFDEISADEEGLSREGEIIFIDFFYLTQVVELMKDFFDALCLKLDGRVFIK